MDKIGLERYSVRFNLSKKGTNMASAEFVYEADNARRYHKPEEKEGLVALWSHATSFLTPKNEQVYVLNRKELNPKANGYISFSQRSPSAAKQNRSNPLSEQSTLYVPPFLSIDPKETRNEFQKMDHYDSVRLIFSTCSFEVTISDSVPNPLILTICSRLH